MACAKGTPDYNEGDCANQKRQGDGSPCQNVGLQEMWTQATLASNLKDITQTCDDETAKLPMNFPGQSMELARIAHANQATTPAGEAAICDMGIGLGKKGTCSYIFDKSLCAAFKDRDACVHAITVPGMTGYETSLLQQCASPANEDKSCMQKLPEEHKGIHEYLGGVQQGAAQDMNTAVGAVLKSMMPTSGSETKNLLGSFCEHKYIMLYIKGSAVKGSGPGSTSPSNPMPLSDPLPVDAVTCDHWIVLEDCSVEGTPHDVVSLWTWGYRLYVTKQFMHEKNFICGAVVADGDA